jgi:hypothetical protein
MELILILKVYNKSRKNESKCEDEKRCNEIIDTLMCDNDRLIVEK